MKRGMKDFMFFPNLIEISTLRPFKGWGSRISAFMIMPKITLQIIGRNGLRSSAQFGTY
jgi:hypothetical protein